VPTRITAAVRSEVISYFASRNRGARFTARSGSGLQLVHRS